MPATISRRKRVRFLEAAAKLARTVHGAEEFMAEIAVTVFEVDEIVPALLGTFCSNDVVGNETLDLVIRHHGIVRA